MTEKTTEPVNDNKKEEFAIHFIRDKVMPNLGRVVLAVLILVLLVLAIMIYFQRTQLAHSSALAELEQADSVEALTIVAEEYAGSDIEAKALLKKGRLLMQQQNDAEAAAEVFREFLDKHPEHRLADSATLGLGAALEAQGAWEEAYEVYGALAKTAQHQDDAYIAGEAWYAAGRCAEGLGKIVEARTAFENVITHGAEAFAEQAQDALLRLASSN